MKNKLNLIGILIIFLLFTCSLLSIRAAEGRDSDLDGIPDSIDQYPFDYDNDGMPDIWEKKHKLRYDMNDAYEDPDEDGVSNINEYKRGTDPFVSDISREKVPPKEAFSPLENKWVRASVWAGIGLISLLVLIFILHKFGILGIFKSIIGIGAKSFEKQRTAMPAYRPVARQMYPPRYPPQGYQRAFARPPLVRPPTQQAPPQMREEPFVPPKIPPVMPIAETPEQPKIETSQLQAEKISEAPAKDYALPREESLDEIAKKQRDIFERLSEHIDDYNKGRRIQRIMR